MSNNMFHGDKVPAFMDGTDWECELGMNANGNTVYPSKEAAEREMGECADECGIAEVEVRFVRWVKEPKPSWK